MKRISTKATGIDRQSATNELSLKPYFERDGAVLYHGDCLQLLPALDAELDAIITDPPYASGGWNLSQLNQDPRMKYCQNGNDRGRPTFSGDSRNQRSLTIWLSTILSQCLALSRESAYVMLFTDWRQATLMTDVIQIAGATWRGTIAWDKGRSSRAPHKGYFRHQCEFIQWGTYGRCEKATHAGPYDGCIREPVRQSDKHHLTGKPTPLMVRLVECVVPGGLVIDPFAGSGTTGVACLQTGRQFIGIEQSEAYCEIAAKRLESAETTTAS